MFRNTLFHPSISNHQGNIITANIDSIDVKSNKSIIITKSMQFPDKSKKIDYQIENRSHVEIALKVLSGELSAKAGLEELCSNENTNEPWHVRTIPLGQLLGSLIPQSMPGNQKIRYIDEEIEMKVKSEIGPLQKTSYCFNL